MRFLLSLLLCVPSFAAIARDGSCSTSGTSCTLSATNTGSLILVFAYRTGSLTAPTLPASNTLVTSAATTSGGTTGSYIVYCRQAASAGDTNTTAATNASGVAAVSYSGTSITGTVGCNTQAVGAIAATFAKASTTISYPGITLYNTGNTDWVAAFAGASITSGTCTPTGMTQLATGTGSGTRTVYDTNATVSTWTTQTCSVSSDTWMTVVLEILQTAPAVTRNHRFIGGGW